MKKFTTNIILLLIFSYSAVLSQSYDQKTIPLPEHPRPDFQRDNWINLNGEWDFQFDKDDVGEFQEWYSGNKRFDKKIVVPFSWGSKLSKVDDESDIGWYRRELSIPADWNGKNVYLIIGACDWHTKIWLDGTYLGEHKGGYTPFEFNLTRSVKAGRTYKLVMKVDDSPAPFKLYGKQGYGRAAGIWQTPYLEARPEFSIDYIHFSPDIDSGRVKVKAGFSIAAPDTLLFRLNFNPDEYQKLIVKKSAVITAENKKESDVYTFDFEDDFDTVEDTAAAGEEAVAAGEETVEIAEDSAFAVEDTTAAPEKYMEWVLQDTVYAGDYEIEFIVDIFNLRLWSLDDPYLYYVDAILTGENNTADTVSTYFGMRKISVVNLPGTDYPYVALNNEPVYLQMSLDQAYHPDGYYTFPSDDFMRDEILRSRRIGLNGQRIHIKVEIPRKLYWADRLGMLIMADVPNSWGEPTPESKAETEYCLRRMIERDYNHPSIFSWVNFNETWGLRNNRNRYTKDTQEWVKSVYNLNKMLDPTRLVEDNSTNNLDHVVTDLNTWHAYIPGHNWDGLLDLYSKETYPGSKFNFVSGYEQSGQPMLNSECGNVWGYEKNDVGYTTGDVDWSWDYHQMINAFRRHPKCAGWLYTEHHDVINEWNGYWRYDRSDKYTGLGEIYPGMSIRDLHSLFYITVGERLFKDVKASEKINVPLYASFYSDAELGDNLILEYELSGWDEFGVQKTYSANQIEIPYKPWMNEPLDSLSITFPAENCLAVLGVTLKTQTGRVLNKNFTTYNVSGSTSKPAETILRFNPDSFTNSEWSLKQWDVLGGLKVNGAGHGYFEYKIPFPQNIDVEKISEANLLLELSAKRLNGKDVEGSRMDNDNFMLGGGTHDPSESPNSYPMTDNNKFPSAVKISVSGEVQKIVDLEDDPADHRGILSWYSQERDLTLPKNPRSFRDFKGGFLHEAGSYGYLTSIYISRQALQKAAQEGELVIKLEVDDSLPGGVAIYGKKFGRYPFDPTIVLKTNYN